MKTHTFLGIGLAIATFATAGATAGAAAGAEGAEPAPPPPALGIRALVAEALANNPELRYYEAERTRARAGVALARLPQSPEVGGSVGRKSVRGAGLQEEGAAWSVTVAQPLEWPGRIGLRKAIANRDLDLADLGLERFRAALAGRVMQLAFAISAAHEKTEAAREVSERFTALREVLLQRDPAGLTPLLEARVIEATGLGLRRRLSAAMQEESEATLELNQLRGKPAEEPVRIAAPAWSLPAPVPLEELRSRARTNSFDLRQRETELSQQGFRVDLARNERWPAVTLGPMVSQEEAGDRERVVGLSVSFPLPLWNGNRARVQEARARLEQAETLLRVAARDVEREVISSSRAYESRWQEMRDWRPDAIEHFRESAGLADRHYRLGAVPVATYVELQKEYLEAVDALIETRREALAAGVRLAELAGIEFDPLPRNPTPAPPAPPPAPGVEPAAPAKGGTP